MRDFPLSRYKTPPKCHVFRCDVQPTIKTVLFVLKGKIEIEE